MADTISILGTLMYNNSGYTDIMSITEIEEGGLKTGVGNANYLGVTDRTKRKNVGWIDPQPIKVKGKFDKTNHGTIRGWQTAASTQTFKLRLNDGTTGTTGSNVTGTGFVTECKIGALSRDSEDPILTEVEIQPDSLWTYSAAT